MSFAKAVVSGQLASDPEKRFTPNNHAVTSFTLAVENEGKNATEPSMVKVTCWRALAETVETQLHKGDYIVVEGKLMMNSFQTQEGVQKKLFEIEANTINKLPGAPEPLAVATSGESSPRSAGVQPAAARPEPTAEPVGVSSGHFSSEELLTEDDIPF